MLQKRFFIIPILATILITCSACFQVMDGPDMVREFKYTQIDQKTALEMMEQDDGHIVVDVRRQDEYDSGHIPDAICIPNESIGNEPPAELPDKQQIILVYCRSGRRSKEAAQKLAEMGYINVYEFGGIIDWSGETVVEETATEETVAEETAVEMTVEATATADPIPELVIKAGEKTFIADLESNSSAQALIEKLNGGEVTIDLHDYGNFEKVGDLPWELPRTDENITTQPGDVILYQGDQITIYYDKNTWDFTRLARIPEVTKEELLDAFGEGNVSVTFSLEWRE